MFWLDSMAKDYFFFNVKKFTLLKKVKKETNKKTKHCSLLPQVGAASLCVPPDQILTCSLHSDEKAANVIVFCVDCLPVAMLSTSKTFISNLKRKISHPTEHIRKLNTVNV